MTATTAVTGEATNYETAINQLATLAEEQQKHLDAAIAARDELMRAKNTIGDVHGSYQAAAAASTSIHESLGALNLDGGTLTLTGTAADAMPVDGVMTLLTHLDEVEVAMVQRVADAETALASTTAAMDHLRATYGDHADAVAANLGGNAEFLNS